MIPFVLTNAPVTVMDLMNRVCTFMLNRLLIVFIDDILDFSETQEQHKVNLREVPEVLRRERFMQSSQSAYFV